MDELVHKFILTLPAATDDRRASADGLGALCDGAPVSGVASAAG
jgi:hypothetical protein